MIKLMDERIALFTDIHFGKSRDNVTKLENTEKFIDHFIDELTQKKIETVFFLGDWFEHQHSVNIHTYHTGYNCLKKLAENFKVYVILGNHDTYYKHTVDVNSVKAFDEIPNVEVIEYTTEIDINGKKGLLCPWGFDIRKYKKKTYNYIFGHFEFNGASLTGSTFEGSNYGMHELVKLSPLVFSGHFHIRKEYPFEKGKIITVGSPFQLDWGDYKNTKGYYILDTVTEKYKFHQNKVSPGYHKYFWSKVKDGKQKIEKSVVENSYIKLVVDCRYNYEDIMRKMSEINDLKPIKAETDFVFSINADLLGEMKFDKTQLKMTKLEYITKFIEKLDTSPDVKKKDIINLAKQYYQLCEGNMAIYGGQRVTFKKIEVENFKSIGPKMEFDFQKHSGLNYIFGNNLDKPGVRNGSGKSTIFVDALIFALFGKTLKNTNNKFIPCRSIPKVKGQNILTDVTLWFDVAGKSYKIRQYMQKHLNDVISCQLWEGGEDEKHETTLGARETRKHLATDILKCDYDLFKRSVILSASDTHNFFGMKKGHRREYVESVFRLVVFGEMLKAIRADNNNLDREIMTLQREAKQIKDTLTDFEGKSDSFEADKKKEIDRIGAKIIEKGGRMEDLKVKLTETELLQEKEVAGLEKLQKELNELSEASIKVTNILQNSAREVSRCTSQVNKHSEVYDIICTDCKEIFKNSFNIDELQQNIEDENKQQLEYDTITKTLEAEKSALTTKIKSLKIIKEEISTKKGDIEHNIWVKNHLAEDIVKLNNQIEEEKKKKSPFSDLIKKNNKLFKEKETALKGYYKDKTNLDILELTVSEEGAKKYIIKDLVEVLNTLVRKYLEETGADFTVIFDSSFETVFLTTTGECEYSSFSAGECARLGWATTLAFRDILTSSIEANIHIIDEMLDIAVDNFAIKSLLSILNRQIVDKNQTIYLISHRESLEEELYNNVIEIEKLNSFSKIIRDPQGGVEPDSNN